MVSFSKLLVAAASVAGVLAAPAELVSRQTLTASATGNHGGYYYSFWTDGGGSIRFTLESGGAYSVTWSGNNGNWVGGKGWQPGTTNRYDCKTKWGISVSTRTPVC
jgi:endo-1,4-beta-xylanase